MAKYAIGDLQGCFTPLIALLDQVDFNPSQDHLYFVGDIIARGPDPLACLEFLYQHADSISVTLGNHDLHFLACLALGMPPNPKDKLDAVFNSPKCQKYADLLRAQPLAIWLEQQQTLISHAGIHPSWSIEQALNYAHFAEANYQSTKAPEFYANMYGAHPGLELDKLSEQDKFKAIVNVFTRMRFLKQNGELDLKNKSGLKDNDGLIPWFEYGQIPPNTTLLFGHWAALEGETHQKNVIALDTGCVWGGAMTMINIDTGEKYQQA
ncbi:symmetrical bis(5'-nucleosyl)-tetraphosphatase [Pseudoalteromonas sp. McH1-7]|uniref:bis(5'-nucleosyl)-tetraphosphatase (symmetrical) n=1 Tax=Pseudoalteromonas peptidolytica F12-50-A1 TaxID=1315280 RepID=A0A8I0MU70_9GAMM|nr:MULTISPECIES: symmetrical bis(5'-nucleosyl)-tetraphosphatase [Pseudoalteromonas]MBE0345340.1 bis(5'-nucleosyl)-tetraphosphatase (symmetrical) [Pseudoalteromonas peptidolytica F12-50-A1]MDW7547437.1 symmetrical bis(5'-nucleosyl)-tetraphosphatase [Pseudoalteromonas peptidolytica]NLR15889.1 symmetrical bis(5'-nucleosyl)-tetraphosphatase [Pseudoalteromonas peptidolytica]NUZ09862.1 symmetrical bis(5'-nucleosyl)-tetraphosphatase [Pseudoalteromonas sp. McH1-7]GEK10906.1 bis(5'-nucleosyl)-tetraphos